MTYVKVRGPDSNGGVVRGRALMPLAFADDLPGVLHGWERSGAGLASPGVPDSPFQRCGGDGVGHGQLGRAWERWMPGVGIHRSRWSAFSAGIGWISTSKALGRDGTGPSTNMSST
jgi:hypothetical protein